MSRRSAAETPTLTTGTPSSQVSIRTMLVRPSAIRKGNSLCPSNARTTLVRALVFLLYAQTGFPHMK